jgi:hypothetical protein
MSDSVRLKFIHNLEHLKVSALRNNVFLVNVLIVFLKLYYLIGEFCNGCIAKKACY